MRIIRVEHQIDRAGLVISKKDFLPLLAAVIRTEYAAHFVRPISVPQRSHVHDVGILRMHHNLRDVLRIVEADVRPRLPAVHGLVHPVPIRNISANARFPGAHVNHIRVRRRYRNRANGHDSGFVRHGRPRQPTVLRLPHTASHGAEVIRLRIASHSRNSKRAPATKWPNLPPLHAFQRFFI